MGKFTPGMRNPPNQGGALASSVGVAPVVGMQQQAVVVHGQEPLTASMLSSAAPQDQKQMLGERLFPLIQRMYPDMAGKITGICSRSTTLNWSTCSSTTNHSKPRWMKLLLCSRLTRLSKWPPPWLQLSPRRSKRERRCSKF